MYGVDVSGRQVFKQRGFERPASPGPLAAHQVHDLRQTICEGLRGLGYSVRQVAQVLNASKSSIENYGKPDVRAIAVGKSPARPVAPARPAGLSRGEAAELSADYADDPTAAAWIATQASG